MDPVINSVLQSPLARNLNHIATDSTQFTYHVEQNAPPLSLKKGYIDSSQSFVGFDNTYTFTLPQWGYMAKNILRLQYQIKPNQRTHVTPVLPLYHMIEKVELMSHNNVIETLYGDSIMIKHAYYSESCCAATKMMGTLNVPPESGNYVDIAALFRDSTNGTPFNPFDHTQWNNSTNCRTVTLFLELPFSFTDNPAMYFDTRFVEFLTIQVKLSSTKHGMPLFQAACCVEIDMGDDNIQLDPSRHKNNVVATQYSASSSFSGGNFDNNKSTYYENKQAPSNSGNSGTAAPANSASVQGCSKFYYRPFFTRAIANGFSEHGYQDGAFNAASFHGSDGESQNLGINVGFDTRASIATSYDGSTDADKFTTNESKGLDPFELQLGGRPGSRLPSKMPLWMDGFYPSADKNGLYACAHSGEPRFIRVGACNYSASHYTVGYWGFLETGGAETSDYGVNKAGLGSNTQLTIVDTAYSATYETGVFKERTGTGGTSYTNSVTTGDYADEKIVKYAALWAQYGGKFVYDKKEIFGSRMPPDVTANGSGSDIVTANTTNTGSSTNSTGQFGDDHTESTSKYWVNISTQTALIERFYAMYPYLNLSNQPPSQNRWTGDSSNENYGHGYMATDQLVVEGSRNNESYEGLPKANSVNMKLLVTYLSLHDRVREQVSMDNFKDNMPATILMHDTFQEYNGILYGTADSPWATETNQTMVVPIRSKNLAYAISVVAYKHRTDQQLVGGNVYNILQDGSGPEMSKLDISMDTQQITAEDGLNPNTSVTKLCGKVADPTLEEMENFQAGELTLAQRKTKRGALSTGEKSLSKLDSTTLTRWNGSKSKFPVASSFKDSTTSTNRDEGQLREVKLAAEAQFLKPPNGFDISTRASKGPCIMSDPSFVWPNYKVVEQFKTVKPTHVKLSIAGQSVYETAQQTALANSYYSTTSDSYTPVNGGGQWFVEKDLDNLPYHYNQGSNSRGDMGSVARLPNIVGTSQMGGTLQEHCDCHVITFGLNKTDQLSNNGALGLSSATNAQLELKFAEPCRVSVYVHYHATLQIDSNTGVMSRSLDV